MVYETFLETVRKTLEEQLGEDCRVTIHPIPRNNGKIMDGLSILMPGSRMAPTIYLNPYYELYGEHMSMEEIICDILELFHNNPAPDYITPDQIADFSLLREKVIFKVVHAASNQFLLQDIPYIPYLDLAIVFCLFLERNSTGQMTALIHNEHMALWGVKAKDLLDLAFVNTPREFPAEIKNMEDLMKEMVREQLTDDFDESLIDSLIGSDEGRFPLYILSNRTGVNGAGCILYHDVLKDFADSLGKDLIVLPSSIHEVLLTPDEPGISLEELSNLVTCINTREVPDEDQLSNQVYLYSRAANCLRIASHSGSIPGSSDLTNRHFS